MHSYGLETTAPKEARYFILRAEGHLWHCLPDRGTGGPGDEICPENFVTFYCGGTFGVNIPSRRMVSAIFSHGGENGLSEQAGMS